jgi:hypothetical protein
MITILKRVKMTAQDPSQYIIEQRKAGFDDKAIRSAMGNHGWKKEDIDKIFRELARTENHLTATISLNKEGNIFSDVKVILDSTWERFQRKFPELFQIAVVGGVVAVLSGIIAYVNTGDFIENIDKWANASRAIGMGSRVAISGMAVFAFTLIDIWVILALLMIAAEKEKINFQKLFEQSIRRYFSFLGVYIILILVLSAGVLLAVIPALIFAVWFFFAIPLAVIENVFGFEALKKSKELVKGKWWNIAFKGLIFLIMLVLFQLLFAYVGRSVLGIASASRFGVSLMVNFLSAVVVEPFMVVLWVVWYEYERTRTHTEAFSVDGTNKNKQ